MPVSLEFLRGLLGAISLFFAHFLGRTIAQTSKGKARRRPLFTWTLRYTLSICAVLYRGVDRLAIIFLALGVVLFALGWWDEWRPKHEEDLTRKMFPEDD
jgi:hypothetical protein